MANDGVTRNADSGGAPGHKVVQDASFSSSSSNDEERRQGGTSAEAAGVARGVSRSILRSPIGQLPRRRIPIRRVARVSDRVATGWDWYSTAVESTTTTSTSATTTTSTTFKNGDTTTTTGKSHMRERVLRVVQGWRQEYWPRVKTFTRSIAKNTLLGLVVFETYGSVISRMAPEGTTSADLRQQQKQQDEESTTKLSINSILNTDIESVIVDRTLIDDEHENQVVQDSLDEYARASLSVHVGAGLAAGSVHGVVVSVLESKALLAASRPTISHFLHITAAQTLYHGLSHSLLFGSYEGIKRILIHNLYSVDNSTEYYGAGYLASFVVAGGVAGQVQHVSSHYGEQYLEMRGLEYGSTAVAHSSSFSSVFRSMARPALRQTLRAFPPAAIGFVAFEYGKKFAA
jgi:hypothetical protein